MTEHSSYVRIASSIVGIAVVILAFVSSWRRRSGNAIESKRYRMAAWILLAVATTLLIAAPHVH